MPFVLQPWQLLVAILAGWLNRQQQAIIDFQQTEIQILWERLGKKRINRPVPGRTRDHRESTQS